MSEVPKLYLTSSEIATELSDTVAVAKAKQPFGKLVMSAILAGTYISIGGMFSKAVTFDLYTHFGMGFSQMIMGLAFSLGLVLVSIAGAELFTGNTLMIIGLLKRKITPIELIRNWTIVFFANFLGSLLVATIYYYTNLWQMSDNALALSIIKTANAKTGLTFIEALSRGIFANWLVCLAVYIGAAAKTPSGKILGIIFPTMAFVALGMEHSIANMYSISMGLFLKAAPIAELANMNLQNLTWSNFLINNLIPVTIGNIIGGAIFVGMAYWYLHRSSNK